MKISKIIKFSAVGLALLLIPRRSSRQSEKHENNGKVKTVNNNEANSKH